MFLFLFFVLFHLFLCLFVLLYFCLFVCLLLLFRDVLLNAFLSEEESTLVYLLVDNLNYKGLRQSDWISRV